MSMFTLAAALLGVSAAAQPERGVPQPLVRLAECKTISDPGQRLACFDREAAALEGALGSGALVARDRDEIEGERRAQFGSLSNESRDADREASNMEVREVTGVLRAAFQNASGRWVFNLEDGATWTQTDSRQLKSVPRAGQTIRVRRAAMGSYLANVNNQIAVRVQRTR